MKVIVNNQTQLIVEDEKGNILFQWLPQEKQLNTYGFIDKGEIVLNREQMQQLLNKMKMYGWK